MRAQEKQKASHLVILICYTIFTIVLTAESLLLGWQPVIVLLLLAALTAAWVIHITDTFTEHIRLWVYFVMSMLAYVFYGIHETSMYDLAPVMIFVIIVYSITEKELFITLCVSVYVLMLLSDALFVLDESFALTPLMLTRTLLHCALVYTTGRLTKIVIRRRHKERSETEAKIAALEDANRRTEDFLTNVSHELRTPINAVIGMTSVILKNEADDRKKKDIRSVQMAGYRLFNQIEDILDYTEIDTGKIKVSSSDYMISSVINDIITADRLLGREYLPELIFDIDANMPSMLIGDSRKIKKIIRHLIDNSFKFTKHGGIYVRIYTLQKPYGINLCIKVADTGIGIKEENLQKISRKFYQSDTGSSRMAGGLGLGLPIVYGFASAMEGFMHIESAPENGTAVSVSIPQRVSDSTPIAALANKAALFIVLFIRLEKFDVPAVRNYYNEMIAHLAQALDTPIHRVFTIEELQKLLSLYKATHIFTGSDEYSAHRSSFERLDSAIEIVVIADAAFTPPHSSRVKTLYKPVYCLPIINSLNAKNAGGAFRSAKQLRMLCPDVKVLVVDDEPMNLMVAEGIFKDYQMQVTLAESGIRAIELCEKEDFDLIFLDHMMPEMDGVETLKRLHKIHTASNKALTVIAFTANAVSGAREMFLQAGFNEFISKPIDTMELERILRKMLPKPLITFIEESPAEPQYAAAKSAAAEYRAPARAQPETHGKPQAGWELDSIGVNTQAGLQYCRNDSAFYRELLLKFAGSQAAKEAELTAFLTEKDFGDYRILVHSLKSTAKMLGAASLSELAARAEEAAKNADGEYISAHHDELVSVYRRIAHGIRTSLAADSAAAAQDSSAAYPGTEITQHELLDRLTLLRQTLDTSEAEKAQAIISDLCGFVYRAAAVAELIQYIRQDADDFEFSAAARKTDALIKDITEETA